jgi:hypothetical protein
VGAIQIEIFRHIKKPEVSSFPFITAYITEPPVPVTKETVFLIHSLSLGDETSRGKQRREQQESNASHGIGRQYTG